MKHLLYILAFSVVIFSCKNNETLHLPVYDDPKPRYDSLLINSVHVNEERRINIWTPTGYQQGIDSLPVLYMPDGGLHEDFPHIVETLRQLIKDKKVKPHILVGIENTDRRRDLTGWSNSSYDAQYCPVTDGAKNFRAFINKELIPEINKKYTTTSKKGIIGESLAGLFIVETLFLSPNSFDFYIAMDPSLWWNNHYLTHNADSLISNLPQKEKTLWFAGSSAKDIKKYTRELDKKLNANKPANLNWHYADKPKEKHHTIYRATKQDALIYTIGIVND